MSLQDVCGVAPPLEPRPNAATGFGPMGPMGRSAGGNSFYLLPNSRWPRALEMQQLTLFWRGRFVGSPGVNGTLLGTMWNEAAPGSPWVCYNIGVNGNGRLIWSVNTGPTASLFGTASANHPTADMFDAALAIPGAGNGSAVLYQDGEPVAGAAMTSPISYAGLPNLSVGGDTNEVARTTSSECAVAMVIPRALTQAELKLLRADPLQWLTPAS